MFCPHARTSMSDWAEDLEGGSKGEDPLGVRWRWALNKRVTPADRWARECGKAPIYQVRTPLKKKHRAPTEQNASSLFDSISSVAASVGLPFGDS